MNTVGRYRVLRPAAVYRHPGGGEETYGAALDSGVGRPAQRLRPIRVRLGTVLVMADVQM